MTDDSHRHRLLICTVGGTPEPLAKSLLHWRPERVVFVPSNQTRPQVDAVLGRYAEHDGQPLTPGCYRVCPVDDAENLSGCLRVIRALDQEVKEWLNRDGDFEVVADFTAGTKCMSAALALQARRWRCQFSYVGGGRRTKEGVGVVETGSERVVHAANPWDTLGYQVMEECVEVFNHGGYAAAGELLENAISKTGGQAVKRELATLRSLADAYAAWDRFDHAAAARCFDGTLKNRNDLAQIFPDAHSLIAQLERHRNHVAQLAESNEPTMAWVEDLLRNSERRADERRYDDAVGRLYRATEALAQVRLRKEYNISDTKAAPIDRLPTPLQNKWSSRCREGVVMLGLQDIYLVLKEFGDDLGARFTVEQLDNVEKSPLIARNQSILAHGFHPVGKDVYLQLHAKFCRLASLSNAVEDRWVLPVMP